MKKKPIYDLCKRVIFVIFERYLSDILRAVINREIKTNSLTNGSLEMFNINQMANNGFTFQNSNLNYKTTNTPSNQI